MSIINYLIKFPILKRLIPSLYKRYIFYFNKYSKNVIIDNVIYDLDLRHLIDRRFFFIRLMKKNYLIPLMILSIIIKSIFF